MALSANILFVVNIISISQRMLSQDESVLFECFVIIWPSEALVGLIIRFGRFGQYVFPNRVKPHAGPSLQGHSKLNKSLDVTCSVPLAV